MFLAAPHRPPTGGSLASIVSDQLGLLIPCILNRPTGVPNRGWSRALMPDRPGGSAAPESRGSGVMAVAAFTVGTVPRFLDDRRSFGSHGGMWATP